METERFLCSRSSGFSVSCPQKIFRRHARKTLLLRTQVNPRPTHLWGKRPLLLLLLALEHQPGVFTSSVWVQAGLLSSISISINIAWRVVYCSACSWCQLSRYISLFPELRVGKVCTKRLEGDLRSYRDCRHAYSLLADAAAIASVQFSSLQFSCSVVSDSLRPHESQHARPPCPSPTPRVHSDSHPSSQWCHPAISSSVVPFSSCPQFLPASESFPMSQLFAWGGQSSGVSWPNTTCLLAGTAARTGFSLGWRSSRGSRHAIFSPLMAGPADIAATQQQCAAFSVELIPHKVLVTKRVPCKPHAQVYKWFQLLHYPYL